MSIPISRETTVRRHYLKNEPYSLSKVSTEDLDTAMSVLFDKESETFLNVLNSEIQRLELKEDVEENASATADVSVEDEIAVRRHYLKNEPYSLSKVPTKDLDTAMSVLFDKKSKAFMNVLNSEIRRLELKENDKEDVSATADVLVEDEIALRKSTENLKWFFPTW